MFLSTHILNSALYDNYQQTNPAENEQHDLQINAQITAMPVVRFIDSSLYEVMIYMLLTYFPILTMLVFPGIVHNVGMELKEKLVHSILGQNGSLVAYWTAVYVFHYGVWCVYHCVCYFSIFNWHGSHSKLQFWPAFCNTDCMGACSNWFWNLSVNGFKKNSFGGAICVYYHVDYDGFSGICFCCTFLILEIFFMAFGSVRFCAFFIFSNRGCCTTAHNCDGNLKHGMDKYCAILLVYVYIIKVYTRILVALYPNTF